MKTLLPKTFLVLSSVYMITACSDANMRFMHSADLASKADTPSEPWTPPVDPIPGVDPTPVVDPTPIPTPVATPVATPAPTPVATPVATPAPTPVATPVATPAPTPVATPVAQDDCAQAGLSQKACYLMKIMELGCPLRDNVPANYQAPSRAQVIANMSRCDAQAYPTTAPTKNQWNVIQRLIDPNDASFRKYIFTGLFYKPEYTDDFKKYFGVELYNSIYTFCYNYGVPPGAGSILPREAIGNDHYVMDKEYKAANVYAGQLNQCVTESMKVK